ncbi:Alpha/Beta hydrolase protein [Entophlyctis helioformis]|nr:Alpha/Beta hydrolase protein [Entophlyctis helioformis]
MVSIDMAGHGQSGHRSREVPYAKLFDIEDAVAVVNALGWKEFAVIGHSMGGINAVYLAGLYPERVKHVVAIETIAPLYYPDDVLTLGILQSFKERGEYSKRDPNVSTKKVFATLEEAAEIRSTGTHPLGLSPSRLLVKRGVKPVSAADGKIVGYEWSSDSRVRSLANPFMTPKELVMNIVSRIQCPVLNIMADHDIPQTFTPLPIQKAFRGHLYLQRVKGSTSHHLHMEEPFAAVVADMMADFWARVADGSLPPSQVTPVSKL